jgi:hypothetical protein
MDSLIVCLLSHLLVYLFQRYVNDQISDFRYQVGAKSDPTSVRHPEKAKSNNSDSHI